MSPSILLSDACTTVGEITKSPNLRTHFCKDVIVSHDLSYTFSRTTKVHFNTHFPRLRNCVSLHIFDLLTLQKYYFYLKYPNFEVKKCRFFYFPPTS